MRRLVRTRPSPAMIVALLALFVALGGGAYAATQINGTLIKKNSMPGDRVNKKTFVAKAKLATNAKHANNADTAKNATNATTASNAGHATNADNATNAGHATNADNATNATTAGNATNLGGQPASGYFPSGALHHASFTLSAGTTGQVLFSNGPLSVTADCAKPAATITVTVNDVSSVANWVDFGGTLEAAAGSTTNLSRNDGGAGTVSGTTNRIELVAPDGTSLRGQIMAAVNYPSAGQCFVSGWAINT